MQLINIYREEKYYWLTFVIKNIDLSRKKYISPIENIINIINCTYTKNVSKLLFLNTFRLKNKPEYRSNLLDVKMTLKEKGLLT